ncbi:formylmethanofuran dehydrogenase subunit A [Dethiosulfatarculus sandiegensis]|uniref:Formylmethanofuran dehydrogenase subunit A n=1 Tax=Dethiosulfatarculus sandiegensis TaxID=1429043 RepID=A0A0D2J1P0_9BACT|nr:formylmethanofuran dehydrogenase subunit A [Dethiosulfatarculus sandiegensis]KIX12129.1 formylmethanofuran dehydrogenase subunit A [Dethiosulfatarculus sandiegensis]
MLTGIINGKVYDPTNNLDGVHADIWIKDGKVVDAATIDTNQADQIIDAKGLVVMAGGVDVHAHIVGAKVNSARKFRPDDHRGHERLREVGFRSGGGYTVPSTFQTGYMYSEMGYTTVMEAATAPLVARHTHEELADTPMLDNGIFVTMGNNHFIMDCIRKGEREKARDYIAWILEATGGYAIKVVNPGGVENWKYSGNVAELDDKVIGFDGVTPRKMLETLCWSANELGLPHPPHIHGLNLGQSTSAGTSAETIEYLNGMNAHFCHLQFLSYEAGKGGIHKSAAPKLAEILNKTEGITMDVGQVIFGPATTMTSDGPLQHKMHLTTGNKWLNDDVENESGGGVVPVEYKAKNPINATMWCAGIELFLSVEDPWKVFLTTDHPNGGPFTHYPQVIKLLMDKDYRAEFMTKLNKKGMKRSIAAELDREYSMYEIAVITRAGTAKALGLTHKGHLGAGADGDVTIYQPNEDKAEMFAHPSYVFKQGELVVRNGKVIKSVPGRTMLIKPSYDKAIVGHIKKWFDESYTINFANFPMTQEELAQAKIVACGG